MMLFCPECGEVGIFHMPYTRIDVAYCPLCDEVFFEIERSTHKADELEGDEDDNFFVDGFCVE